MIHANNICKISEFQKTKGKKTIYTHTEYIFIKRKKKNNTEYIIFCACVVIITKNKEEETTSLLIICRKRNTNTNRFMLF